MKLKKNILLTILLVYYIKGACMHAKLLQLCLTVCEPMNCSPQVPLSLGILQPRILKWVVMPSSRGFPNPGIEPCLLYLLHYQAVSLPLTPLGKPQFIIKGCNLGWGRWERLSRWGRCVGQSMWEREGAFRCVIFSKSPCDHQPRTSLDSVLLSFDGFITWASCNDKETILCQQRSV